jgi:CDP-glycerol glycerophosphotransferase (TagB/SpsB family)
VVSSEYEKELMVTRNNMRQDQLAVTGLPRYDKLSPIDTQEKTILVMPTWRDWSITDEATFRSSDFLESYHQLLTDKLLLQLLEERRLTVKFFPHIEIEKRYRHLLGFESERVKVASYAGEPIQNIIRASSLLVTDYSSIAWDFNYMRKPVVFFHFDRVQYLRERGSYVDLARELPGEVCDRREQVVELIERYARNGFQYRAADDDKSAKFYGFRDVENSARVYAAIRDLGGPSRSRR